MEKMQQEGSKKKLLRKRLKNETLALNSDVEARLQSLFSQIHKEFEKLYLENATLQAKVDALVLAQEQKENAALEKSFQNVSFSFDGKDVVDMATPGSGKTPGKNKGGMPSQQKVALRLKAQTSKFVSSFKPNTLGCSFVREYLGHKDGIWDITAGKLAVPVVGTASADQTAIIWGVDSGRCLLRYQGHAGSVNSIRFHPSRELALTASGDGTAHMWQASVAWESGQKGPSSDDEFESSEKEDPDETNDSLFGSVTLRTPSSVLSGHMSVVIAADWLSAGDQVVTASWDRSAFLWDTQTGEKLQAFTGHDGDLTFVATHPLQKLIVTTSKDTTFRMWDLRSACQSVLVFQGHTDTVTSAVFTKEERLVSASDDRTVKVWDIRNMRAAQATIRLDSPANRISLSSSGMIAIPQDDRNIRIFDLLGQRLARLPRSNRQGHRRMVTASAWLDNPKMNLFTCGFDRAAMGWNIQPPKDKEKDKEEKTSKEK